MIRRLRKIRFQVLVFWVPFCLFAFNTLAHEATCHEEIAGVCHSLHGTWIDAALFQPVYRHEMKPFGAWLTWNHDPVLIPDFIKNIFHPPD